MQYPKLLPKHWAAWRGLAEENAASSGSFVYKGFFKQFEMKMVS